MAAVGAAAQRRVGRIVRRAARTILGRRSIGQPRALDVNVESSPKPADLRFLEKQLNSYNITITGVPYGGMIAALCRDETSAIVAGVSGWTWGNCLEISYLWVREDLRGNGYGTRLLAAIEREGVTRGCGLALLNTFSFQAPAFYEKLGYTVFGVVDDYMAGCTRFYLRKRLTPID
jgi:GNAT superfamily N-acetyltransferase